MENSKPDGMDFFSRNESKVIQTERNFATKERSLVDSDQGRLHIIQTIDKCIQLLSPSKFHSLCHVYSIIGSSVIAEVTGREYRPVAGLAVIDAGSGSLIRLTDNEAFANDQGGAYHCWIESCCEEKANRELIDITFMHNQIYAQINGFNWERKDAAFIWCRYQDVVLDCELEDLPSVLPDGRLWLKETDEGSSWLNMHIASNINEYANITAFVLKRLSDGNPVAESQFSDQDIPASV